MKRRPATPSLNAIKLLCGVTVYVFIVIALLSMLSPNILNVADWLYDDKYVVENSLKYYVDFRPGYPPLGKIPIYLVYVYTAGDSRAVLAFNIATFYVCVVLFYRLARMIARDTESLYGMVVLFVLNPAVIVGLLQPHADFIALAFTIVAMMFILEKKTIATGISIALGSLSKVYPGLLLVPALIATRGLERLVLLSVFASTVWFISLPFLVQDPVMYLSTFVHHFFRGPSESIFAVMDRYYGHTGFLHPLFDAMIYYSHFTTVYRPSPDYHFYYSWRNPLLRCVSTGLQLVGLLPLILYVLRCRLKQKPVNDTVVFKLQVLSFFVVLALSPTQNVLTHVPAYAVACLLLASNRDLLSTTVLALYAIVNGVHSIAWTVTFQYVETLLSFIAFTRVLLTALVVQLVVKHIEVWCS